MSWLSHWVRNKFKKGEKKTKEAAKSAEESFWESLWDQDKTAKNGFQVAGVPKYVIPLVIASVVIYFFIKK